MSVVVIFVGSVQTSGEGGGQMSGDGARHFTCLRSLSAGNGRLLLYFFILHYAIYGSIQAHKHEQLKYIKNTSKIHLFCSCFVL